MRRDSSRTRAGTAELVRTRARLRPWWPVLGLLALCAAGCATETWQGVVSPVHPSTMRRELGLHPPREAPDEVPRLPEPEHLRPCCAFGSELAVSIARVEVFGYRLLNTLGPDDLGRHEYDGGLPLTGSFDLDALKTSEKNGLVYTCRAGFLDTAHIRSWADQTLYLGTWIGANLERGGTLRLRDEGGLREVVLQPIDPSLLRQYSRRELAIPLAQLVAWNLSVWHEIATWYGWSHLKMFPELASAFSPEDFYSNMLGIKLAGALVYDRGAVSEEGYNDEMTSLLAHTLGLLGVQSSELARDASRHTDQVWWDSNAKLPAKNLILRRFFDVNDLRVSPWRVQDVDGEMPEILEESCGGVPVHELWVEETFAGLALEDWVDLRITVSPALLGAGFELPRGEQPVTLQDFTAMVERVRRENFAEFGPSADQPDR